MNEAEWDGWFLSVVWANLTVSIGAVELLVLGASTFAVCFIGVWLLVCMVAGMVLTAPLEATA